MKKIQKVVLKEARVLSDNEMKNLFGGSGSSSGSSCTITAPCGISCTGSECNFIMDENGTTIGISCIESDGTSSVGHC